LLFYEHKKNKHPFFLLTRGLRTRTASLAMKPKGSAITYVAPSRKYKNGDYPGLRMPPFWKDLSHESRITTAGCRT